MHSRIVSRPGHMRETGRFSTRDAGTEADAADDLSYSSCLNSLAVRKCSGTANRVRCEPPPFREVSDGTVSLLGLIGGLNIAVFADSQVVPAKQGACLICFCSRNPWPAGWPALRSRTVKSGCRRNANAAMMEKDVLLHCLRASAGWPRALGFLGSVRLPRSGVQRRSLGPDMGTECKLM